MALKILPVLRSAFTSYNSIGINNSYVTSCVIFDFLKGGGRKSEEGTVNVIK